MSPGSLSFAKLVMMSSAPAKSAGVARCAPQDPLIQSTFFLIFDSDVEHLLCADHPSSRECLFYKSKTMKPTQPQPDCNA